MIVKADQAAKSTANTPWGGMGSMDLLSYCTDDTRPKGSKFSMAAELTLQVGSSIGYHTHPTDEEIYLIVKGQGDYIENDHSVHPIKPGDYTLCPRGEGHALVNTGQEPLVFLAFIAE